jgi:dTDP-4-amino-4,6-dideoxygalactose transaminase
LDRYPEKVNERQKIHQWYLQALGPMSGAKEGWAIQIFEGRVPWQFMSVLCPEGTRKSRLERMARAGIECRTYFAPACHEQAQFTSCPRLDLTVTELLSQRILSLPLWEGMEREDVARVVEELVAG